MLPPSVSQSAALRSAKFDVGADDSRTPFTKRETVEPTERRILVVKSSQHFRAAFGPIAGEILVVDGGGLTTRDYSRMPFRRLRRPIFPLDLQ